MKCYDISIPSMDGFRLTFYHSNSQTISEPKEYIAHIDDCVELFILEEGDVSFLVGGSLYPMEIGDIVISKPNEMHNCIQHTRCVHRHFCFWISAGCEFLLSDFCAHKMGENNLLRLSPEKKQALLSVCTELEQACEENASDQRTFSLSVALLSLAREGIQSSAEPSVIPDELRRVLRHIHENLESISSVKELCEQQFISQSTLTRLFHRHLATSPHSYLESCRLAEARTLLRSGESVTQVAFSVGFSDVSSFIRRFRQRFGITPFQYKNNP